MSRSLSLLEGNSIPQFISLMEEKGFSLISKKDLGKLKKKFKFRNPKVGCNFLGFKMTNPAKRLTSHIFVGIPYSDKIERLFLSSFFTKTRPFVAIQGHSVFEGDDPYQVMLAHIDIAKERTNKGRINKSSKNFIKKNLAQSRMAHRRRVRNGQDYTNKRIRQIPIAV